MKYGKGLGALPLFAALSLLGLASALVSTDSGAQVRFKPSPGLFAPFPAPGLTFPAADVMVALTNNPYNTAKVGWSYAATDVTKITHFEVCAWSAKSGATTCTLPLGENHGTFNSSARATSITLYSQSGQNWLYSVAACKGTIGYNPQCVWSPAKPIRIVAQLEPPQRIKPAAGAVVKVPGSIDFQWSETPNTEFYLLCHEPLSAGANTWACQNYEHTPSNSLDWSTTKSPSGKPLLTKSYSTAAEILNGLGPDATSARQWGVASCRNEYAQGTDGLSRLHCVHQPTLNAFSVDH